MTTKWRVERLAGNYKPWLAERADGRAEGARRCRTWQEAMVYANNRAWIDLCARRKPLESIMKRWQVKPARYNGIGGWYAYPAGCFEAAIWFPNFRRAIRYAHERAVFEYEAKGGD